MDEKFMRRKFLPEDIRNIIYLSHPVLSSDSTRIAWISRKGEEESGLFPSSLHVADAHSGERICERSDCAYRQPYFLKDSNYLLYLSDQSGEFQIYLRNLNTNTFRQLTTLRHGVLRYAVNEQESAIAFEAVLWPEEASNGSAFAEMSPEEKKNWQEEMAYRPYKATELTCKMDEWYGMRKGEYSHIGVIKYNPDLSDQDTQPAQFLLDVSLKMECVYPSWSPDGKKLAFYGYPYTGAKGRQSEVFLCNTGDSDTIQLTKGLFCQPDHAPEFTADGKSVIGMGYPAYEDGSTILLPFLVSVTGESTAQYLPVGMKEDESEIQVCHGVYPMIVGRTEMGEHRSYFKLSSDGKWLYFLSAFCGKTGLYKSMLTNPKNTIRISLPETTEHTDIAAFDLTDENHILWLGADSMHPAELYYNGRPITAANEWLNECELGVTEEFWTKSCDGKVDLQWFLVHPAGEQADETHPAVLYIKGGPETMYTKTFWHEFQALAGAGFTVIYGNPRGSVGFGRSFNAGGICWMNEPMHDLLGMVEDAVSRGYAKHGNIGVTGGSYGGYMTNKLIGRTNVFSAAVTQRSLANPATSYGTGDMGFVSSREIPKNFQMLDYLEDRAKGNIISYIDTFNVPLLILHGMKDYRCSFEQAEQLFVAMRDRRPEIPVRMVAFPEENHNVSRTGKLYNQIRHLKELTDWFVKYLNRDGESHE